MMSEVLLGLQTALSLSNVLFCLAGVVMGTFVGVLPGLGPVASTAILLPITYTLDPTASIIMLSGIYYGAQYGGSTSAILLNIPGDAGAIMTTLEGHKMAERGEAGKALGAAAIGSFIAGCAATALIALFAEPLSRAAASFTSFDYFALMTLGLSLSMVLSNQPLVKAASLVCLGALLGSIGLDPSSGEARYSDLFPGALDGIGFIPLVVGIFGIAEAARSAFEKHKSAGRPASVGSVYPSFSELKEMTPAFLRGTAIGSLLGLLPGGGALLSSFASYSLEKKLARRDEIPFGEGNVKGVAAPEAANNAGAQTSFIPMLTLGIPSNAVMSLLLGALMIHDVAPGPGIADSNPELFWGLIASMWLGNLFLLAINLPMIRVWVKILEIPEWALSMAILAFSLLGVYSVEESMTDVYTALFFGAVGLALMLAKCDPTPLILGFLLGPLMEEHFRRAMIIADGSPAAFLEKPIALAMLAAAAAVTAASCIRRRFL